MLAGFGANGAGRIFQLLTPEQQKEVLERIRVRRAASKKRRGSPRQRKMSHAKAEASGGQYLCVVPCVSYPGAQAIKITNKPAANLTS